GILGCSGQKKSAADLRFMYWGDVSEIKIIKDMVSKFEKDTGFKVSAERAPSGPPYMEKVLTQFAGGSAPDVLFVEVNNFKEFAQKGVLEDLNPYLTKETTIKKSQFYKEIIDRFTIDDKLYVLPRDIAPICVVYYNKKMFDEAGLKYPTDDWNWDDMVRIAKKLVKKDDKGTVTRFGYVDDWPIWEAFVLSNGGKIVDNVKKPTRCVLNSKEAIQGVQFRADLVYKYGITPSPSQMTAMGGMGTADMFMSERVAMFFSGIWKVPMFRQIKNFEWDVVMFPKSPKGLRGFPSGGSGYAVVKTSKNKDAAWKLVTYLAGREGQIKLAQTGLAQPAMIEIAKSKYFLDDQPPKHKDIVLKGVPYITFMPLMPEWEEINVSLIAPAFDKIWSGKEKAAPVIKKLVQEINENYFE
ncbi:MAG TPA: sugar ABC transporter substrate-binding protein, partial [Candidatus Goldiibacteriota bacterium]|nr:sugar ABC transporter substrate-binding protein [Candidatus Goldiibacteriota bacterium]